MPSFDLSVVTVNPETLQITVDGFGPFSLLATGFLQDSGLARAHADGTLDVPLDVWPPVEKWLETIRAIGRGIGQPVVRQMGEAVPLRAVFPPTITDIKAALASIDVAFHMNHRLRGEPMFDPATGTMREGIGHYACRVVGPGQARAQSDTPYPCAFDTGIFSAMASRFAKGVVVTHEPGGCRETGADRCAYALRWRA